MPSNEQTHEPLTLSVSEAARKIGVSRSTMYRLRSEGQIGFAHICEKTVVTRTELQRFIAQLEEQTANERGAA